MLDHKMPVEQHRFHFRQQRIIPVEISPARLHHRHLRISKIGHRVPQKIRRRNKIRIENRDMLAARHLQSFLQRAGLESLAIIAMNVEDRQAQR